MSRSVWSCRTTLDRQRKKKPSYEINHQLQVSVRTQWGSDPNIKHLPTPPRKGCRDPFLLRFNISEKWEKETLPAAQFCFPLATKNISLWPLFWSPTALRVLVFFWPPSLEMQRALCGVCLGSPLRQLWLIQCSCSWVNSLIRSLSFFMKWLFPQEKWERLKQYCASIWHTTSRMFTLNQVAWNCSRPMA